MATGPPPTVLENVPPNPNSSPPFPAPPRPGKLLAVVLLLDPAVLLVDGPIGGFCISGLSCVFGQISRVSVSSKDGEDFMYIISNPTRDHILIIKIAPCLVAHIEQTLL